MSYNGGAVIAMSGKDCVAIASDLRFGVRNQTVAFDHPKVYRVSDRSFVGLPGLISDAQTLVERLKYRTNLYTLKEGREMRPQVLSSVVSSMLYEKRFGPYFVEPVIAGLDSDNKPFICGMDLIGAILNTQDFIVGGTSAQAMFGLAETLWKPDLSPEQLFEVISQVLLNSVDRDALSGWGARVHVLTADKLITRDLKARID